LDSISLYELTDYIKQVIALNFTEAIWVHFEIAQANSSRGHWYLDCIETDASGNQIIAQIQANLWRSTHLSLIEKHGTIIEELLKSGVKINALVKVDFHTRYGLKLQIIDINPAYTLGEIELQRQAIIERLQNEGVFDFNRELFLPEVIQRIAIISSSKAAGYEDFKIHLRDNPYGYTFHTKLFEASMQGQHAALEICEQIDTVSEEDFDVIAILRGGGSKMDLSAFDSYEIGLKIASVNIPILSGIGHEKDISVTDLVANKALKTPTAVANFIVDHNAQYESIVIQIAKQIGDSALFTIQNDIQFINECSHQLKFHTFQWLNIQKSNLDLHSMNLRHLSQNRFVSAFNQLDEVANKIQSLDPKRILARGYSMSYIKGRRVSSIQDVSIGDKLQTILSDGILNSKIESKHD